MQLVQVTIKKVLGNYIQMHDCSLETTGATTDEEGPSKNYDGQGNRTSANGEREMVEIVQLVEVVIMKVLRNYIQKPDWALEIIGMSPLSAISAVRIQSADSIALFKKALFEIMVPAGTSQVSIKSAIESLLTWTNFKTNKPPPEDKVAQKNKGIFNVVMTPDRIPKFFIPSLDIEHNSFQQEPEEDAVKNSAKRRVSDEVVKKCRTTRSKSESYIREDALCKGESLDRRGTFSFTNRMIFPGDLERAAYHSDPETRAALSLPHLSKITTPYGFLTLGESPNTRRKESLFFQHDSEELKILLSQRKKTKPLVRSSSSPLSELRQTIKYVKPSATLFKNRRAVSFEAACDSHGSPLHGKSVSDTNPMKCEKKSFQMTMKRHLVCIKRVRSGSGVNWLC